MTLADLIESLNQAATDLEEEVDPNEVAEDIRSIAERADNEGIK